MDCRHILAATPILLFAFDEKAQILFFEGSGLGVRPADEGDALRVLSGLIPGLREDMARVLEGQVLIKTVANGQLSLRVHYTPLKFADGVTRGGAAFAADEWTLVAEREKAIIASERKSRFVANLSHELRTPMNAILGMAEVLAGSTLTREQHQQVDVMRRAAQNLLHLINDILDLSKVEAGKIALEVVEFNLQQSLLHAFEIVIRKANQKGIKLLMDIENELPTTLVGDPHRLQQVLLNLLDNAIKFTTQGFVRLAVRRDPTTRGAPSLLFSISDTGAGIPKDKLKLIFESFTQADSSITRRYGGTGLGLTIAKDLVELMGGTIEVDSEEGKGTTFFFHLPVITPEKREPRGETAPPPSDISGELHAHTILLGDDSEDNRLLVHAFLKGCPYRIDTADNGRLTVEKFKAGAYDVVLMDMQMPELDGCSATREIRAWEAANGRPRARILSLTAHAFPEDVEKAIAAGSDGHLAKPITRNELVSAIEGVKAIWFDTTHRPEPVPEIGPSREPVAERVPEKSDGDILVDVPPRLAALVPAMLERRRGEIRAMKEALEKSDFAAIEASAHKMRGDSGSYGFHGITEIARELESHAKESDADKVGIDIVRLIDYLSRCVLKSGVKAEAAVPPPPPGS